MIADLEWEGVRTEGPYLCHNAHRAGLSNAQKAIADRWRAQFAEAPYATPTRTELLTQSADAKTILDFLLKSGEWTELKDGILLRTEDYERAIRSTVEAIRTDGPLTVAKFRDLIGTTRKYALPLLDRFDRLGYTRREGDQRVAGPRAQEVAADA
jgi:selenocysteine-specific elongation factor